MLSARAAHSQSSRNIEDTLKSPSHLIGHLLPRHANFRARIHIHQISSVPLVNGEFGVRWKFKGVQSSSAQKKGLLGRVKAKTKINDKGKGRELDVDLLLPSAPNYDVFPITPILAHPAAVTPVELSSSILPTDRSTSLSSVETDHTSSLLPSSQSSLTVSSQPTLHWADSSTSATANPSHATMVPDSTLSDLHDPLNVPIGATLRRGTTPFLKLKDHSVIWSHTLDTLLKFDIDRETSQIHPNPLKLVVMQRVIPDDPDGTPQNPRLGAVYLNLAEYIGKGSVERKYLLKESKTNSVLKVPCCFSCLYRLLMLFFFFVKLTIELEYVSGETIYIAPPLPKGEILNEITGFLDNGSVRKRPRALNLYGPYRDQEELEKDLLGTARSGRLTGKFPKSAKSARSQRTINRKPSNGSATPVESDSEEEPLPDDTDDLDDDDDVDLAFDIQRLPHAYGTKTTETIIEALFNPVKITDMQYESPFTIYEPPPAVTAPGFEKTKKSMNIGLGLSRGLQQHNNHDASMNNKRQNSDTSSSFYHYSTGSSSTSLHTTNTTSTSSRGRSKESGTSSIREARVEGEVVEDLTATATASSFGGVRGWWKRHTTRPDSPMTTARA